MNYGQLQTQFQRVFTRQDYTASDLANFIGTAIQRIQRILRVPASEDTYTFTVATGFDGSVGFPIPSDYLSMVHMYVNGHDLSARSFNTVCDYARTTGQPIFYCRNNDNFLLGPTPAVGSVVKFVYRRDFSNLSNPTDSNWLTEIASDLVIAGTMVEACGAFNDTRLPLWEQKFQQRLQELQAQADFDELTNAVISPGTSFDGGWP